MQSAVTFNMYETIKINLCYLAQGYTLTLNIRLGKEGQDHKRRSIYNEFSYFSNKYPGVSKLATIKLDLSYFLTIDNPVEKKNIFIAPGDIYMIRGFFGNIPAMFNDPETFKLLFGKDKDGNPIALQSDLNGASFRLVSGDTLYYKFMILEREHTSEYGLRFGTTNTDCVFDISLNQFYILADIFLMTDFYGMCMSAISGIMELGINNTSYIEQSTDMKREINEHQPASGGTGRRPMVNGNKNNFSMLS